MVHPAGQQVNPSPLAGPISSASEHKVLIGSNDFLLSYSPLDWRGLSSGGGIPSPLALCSIRFQPNTVTCKHFLPQLRVGSASFMATQSVYTHTHEINVSKLHCDASSFILFSSSSFLTLATTT